MIEPLIKHATCVCRTEEVNGYECLLLEWNDKSFYHNSLKVGLRPTFAHPLGFLIAKLIIGTETFLQGDRRTLKLSTSFLIGRQTDRETVYIIFDKETDGHRNCLHRETDGHRNCLHKETDGQRNCLHKETDGHKKCLHFSDKYSDKS